MNKTSRCPRCGAELTGQAVGNLCASCLLKLALNVPVKADRAALEGTVAAPGFAEDLTSPTEMGAEALGCSIGRYKLLERIGEGGGGVVYVAEQSAPIHRLVALKVIKLSLTRARIIFD